MLKSIHDGVFEQSNSTTMNYATGLAYCTETGLPLGTPGYYSMVFKNLTRVWRYDPTGDTCGVPVRIVTSDVAVDCMGGTINSTNVDFMVSDANNVVVQNCVLMGNVLNAQNANVIITNSTIIANARSDTAFSGRASNLFVINTKIIGYDNYSLDLANSTLLLLSSSSLKGPGAVVQNGYVEAGTVARIRYSYETIFLLLLSSAFGIALILYSLIGGRSRKRN